MKILISCAVVLIYASWLALSLVIAWVVANQPSFAIRSLFFGAFAAISFLSIAALWIVWSSGGWSRIWSAIGVALFMSAFGWASGLWKDSQIARFATADDGEWVSYPGMVSVTVPRSFAPPERLEPIVLGNFAGVSFSRDRYGDGGTGGSAGVTKVAFLFFRLNGDALLNDVRPGTGAEGAAEIAPSRVRPSGVSPIDFDYRHFVFLSRSGANLFFRDAHGCVLIVYQEPAAHFWSFFELDASNVDEIAATQLFQQINARVRVLPDFDERLSLARAAFEKDTAMRTRLLSE